MDEQNSNDKELDDSLGDIFKEDSFTGEHIGEIKPKSLHKVKKNSLIFGVCTGIADYFGIEPVIIRIIFVVSIFLGGWGIAAYFIAAMLIPSEITVYEESAETIDENDYTKTITGSFFVFIGLFFIADNFGFTGNLFFFSLPKFLVVPIILIAAGTFILAKRNSFKRFNSGIRKQRFFRSMRDRRLFGVCGGLADYLNIESNNLRMLWIMFSFVTIGAGAFLYLIMAGISKTENGIQIEI